MMKNHTVYVTDPCGRPFDPSARIDTMTETEFDHYLRSMKPSERILALCDRVDEIQKEAGVYDEVMERANRPDEVRRRAERANSMVTVLMSLNEED
jgi:hypothetical protein